MSDLAAVPLTPNPPVDPRWELAVRVADSPQLRTSPKLRAFLLYVCENALLGRVENVREQLIGSRVFGRAPDYNLSEDNIVRVEARELRKRLEIHFSGPGRLEPTVIEIPKGGYLPVFRQREPVAVGIAEPDAAEPKAEAKPGPKSLRPAAVAGVVCVAALLVSTIWLAIENRRLRQLPSTPATSHSVSAADYSFYSELLGTLGATDREAMLLLSNPSVVLYYGSTGNQARVFDSAGHTVPAPPALRNSFADALNNDDRGLPYQFLHATREEYTGMGEATAAYHVGRLMQFLRRPIRLSQARFLNWDQVQKQDLIVLGAPQINDWTGQNVGRSNFNMLPGAIENVSPLPGEQKQYVRHVESGTKPSPALTTWGVINMLSASHPSRILLLAGETSAATAGVGEFFTNPEKMRPVYERIRAAAGGHVPPNWEALIKVSIRDSLPVESSLVAVRPAQGAK